MINDTACSVASSSKEKSVPNLRWSRLNLSRVGHVFTGEQWEKNDKISSLHSHVHMLVESLSGTLKHRIQPASGGIISAPLLMFVLLGLIFSVNP